MTEVVARLGASPLPGGSCRFAVWAPAAARVEVHLLDPDRLEPLRPAGDGYFEGLVADAGPGRRYTYRLDGGEGLPDPASALQPEGVAGPSDVVDPEFAWTDGGWRGRPMDELVLYELHVGTFTPEGTFDAIVARLPALAELGVTALELMPVAQFPGERNWGYDGVFPYAVQHSYGGPHGLKRLVDACHARGPRRVPGCRLQPPRARGERTSPGSAPYFTDRYRTPWGAAINMDGRGCDGVRALLIGSALRFFDEFHVDALRLDAVAPDRRRLGRPLPRRACRPHAGAGRASRAAAAPDRRERPERSPHGHRPRRRRAGDGRAVERRPASRPARAPDRRAGGLLRRLRRHCAHLAKAYRDAFVYDGARSRVSAAAATARPARGVPADHFVVFTQNHDQVGNRLLGDRLARHVPVERRKLAAGARAALAVRAAALHGRGVRRDGAVPVLRRATPTRR